MLPASRHKGDLIAAFCLAGFGGYVAYAGSKLSYVSEVGPGPGFFPFWIGIGLLLLSCYQLIFTATTPSRQQSMARSWRGGSRAGAAWLAVAASIFLHRWLGFAASFILLAVFLMVVLEGRAVRRALAIGAVLALGFHLLFVVALGISLPAGPWGF